MWPFFMSSKRSETKKLNEGEQYKQKKEFEEIPHMIKVSLSWLYR